MKRLSFFLSSGVLAVCLMAFVPTTAQAGSSITIHTPGLSIGLHDVHHSHKYKKRKYRKRYRKNYYNDYYNYRPRRSHNYNRSYYNGNRNGYRKSYRNRSYNYCPDYGYSRYNYSDQDCYSHGGHYHCN